MQNYQNVVPNVFVCQKSQILGVFFGFVCEKTWRAGQIDLKLGMQKLWILFWKKPENNNFIPAALHCEFDIWNIQIFSKYFHNLDQGKHSWIPFFKGSGQLVPFIWFTSFPQPVWIATDSLAIQLLQKTVFNSYPNINWKWNCKGDNIQIFLSEIILTWENGSQGRNFGQILNSKFLKSLRHSALVFEQQGGF